MRKILILVICLIVPVFLTIAGPNDILGTWLSSEKTGKIEIYKSDNKYYGKLIWLSEPNDKNGKPKLDAHNPDTKHQSRKIIGLVIMNGLKYDGDNEWEDGEIYDPKTGNTYSCEMELNSKNELEITGFMGFSFIGKTVVWTKVD